MFAGLRPAELSRLTWNKIDLAEGTVTIDGRTTPQHDISVNQMPRSDLLLSLVRASKRGDRSLLQKTVEAIAAEERAKRHHVQQTFSKNMLHPNFSLLYSAVRFPVGNRGLSNH